MNQFLSVFKNGRVEYVNVNQIQKIRMARNGDLVADLLSNETWELTHDFNLEDLMKTEVVPGNGICRQIFCAEAPTIWHETNIIGWNLDTSQAGFHIPITIDQVSEDHSMGQFYVIADGTSWVMPGNKTFDTWDMVLEYANSQREEIQKNKDKLKPRGSRTETRVLMTGMAMMHKVAKEEEEK